MRRVAPRVTTAAWSGKFVFGEAWAAYEGHADTNSPHEHVAVQVVIVREPAGTATVTAGREIVGRALVVRPLVRHALAASGLLWLVYLEPDSPLGRALLDRCGGDEVVRLPRALERLAVDATLPADWIASLEASLDVERWTLDERLALALRALADDPGSLRIVQAAASSGLSSSRLRALAREQLGLPLATWLLWRKLERAGRAIATRAPLAEAAAMGGFADQAHLARAMRRMFGVSPRMAASALT